MICSLLDLVKNLMEKVLQKPGTFGKAPKCYCAEDTVAYFGESVAKLTAVSQPAGFATGPKRGGSVVRAPVGCPDRGGVG